MRDSVVSAIVLAGCGMLLSVPVQATTIFEDEFTCPVGGEKFTSSVIGSYSSFGQRPDGRPYGTLPIVPIIECPGNGFLLIQEEYSDSEIAALTEAVASTEYQAMRTTETQNYRAWWLGRVIGNDPYALAGDLLRACWETDEMPSRKARYQAAFVEAAMVLDPTAGDGSDWFWLNLRAANALRELARFDEAGALLDRLDRPGALPTDHDEIEGARYLIDGLRILIGEANTASEPANLVPPREASFRCVINRDGLTPVERETCASPEIGEVIAETTIQTQSGQELTGEEAIRYLAETYY